MTDRKPGLNAYERRYVAVLAAVVLVFVIVGIVMSYFPPQYVSNPMPIKMEELLLPDAVPDTARLHREKKSSNKRHKDSSAKKRSSKKKGKRDTGKEKSTPTVPARDPVHSAPIPSD